MLRRDAMRWVTACLVALGFVALCGYAFGDCPDYENNCGTGQCCFDYQQCQWDSSPCQNTYVQCQSGTMIGYWEYFNDGIFSKCYAGGTCAPNGEEEQTPCDNNCLKCYVQLV